MGEGGGQRQIEETHELLLFLQVIKSVLIISEHFHKFAGANEDQWRDVLIAGEIKVGEGGKMHGIDQIQCGLR